MKLKSTFTHLALYATLLATYGSTGFFGTIHTLAYYFAVFCAWVALFSLSLIIGFLSHPKVQEKFRLNAGPYVTNANIAFTMVWGVITASTWIYMQSPWMFAGTLIVTAMLTFLKTYRAVKRDSH